MYQENRDSFLVLFADKEQSVSVQEIKESRFSLQLQNIAQDYGLSHVVLLNQIHSAQGLIVQKKFESGWFADSGDFLVTDQKNIALMILTADCVPLILYDSVHHAVGLIHAGWKGAYAGILQQVLDVMFRTYGTQINDLIGIFGPSARSCCYQVNADFVSNFVLKYADQVQFLNQNGAWFFDNHLFLKNQLKKFGILEENIYTDNAFCTICNPRFCSFRKDKNDAKRQVTMVALL